MPVHAQALKVFYKLHQTITNMQNPAFSWPRVASLALAALLLQACSGSKIPSLNTQMQPSSTQQRCQDQSTQSAVLSIPYDPPQAPPLGVVWELHPNMGADCICLCVGSIEVH